MTSRVPPPPPPPYSDITSVCPGGRRLPVTGCDPGRASGCPHPRHTGSGTHKIPTMMGYMPEAHLPTLTRCWPAVVGSKWQGPGRHRPSPARPAHTRHTCIIYPASRGDVPLRPGCWSRPAWDPPGPAPRTADLPPAICQRVMPWPPAHCLGVTPIIVRPSGAPAESCRILPDTGHPIVCAHGESVPPTESTSCHTDTLSSTGPISPVCV